MASPSNVVHSYVPAILLRWHAEDPSRLTRAHSEHRFVVAFFADIVGFTALAQRLSQLGRLDSEELSRRLNLNFDQLIHHIHDHGGEVFKFAGDAVLALWFADDQDALTEAAQCAARCALAVMPGADTGRLPIRVGLGLGEVLVAAVGEEHGQRELLVGGSPITQVSAACGQASPNEVVASAEVWARLGGHGNGGHLSSSQWHGEPRENACQRLLAPRDGLTEEPSTPPRQVAISGPAQALRAFIPPPVLASLDVGQGEWLAELRRVTVLFTHVQRLDFAALDALEVLQETTVLVQRALARHRGTLLQMMVDDKGTILIAGWGLPGQTYEDDAARGVEASFEIHRILDDAGLGGAIGITTGRAFCGTRGNQLRREYAAIGRVVNIAARLMQAAGNGILCDAATRDAAAAARDSLYFTTRSPIRVKGEDEPVAIYCPRLTEPERPASGPVPKATGELFGRAAERHFLASELARTVEGEAAKVVIIEGEAGIGKTRLLEDLLTSARQGNVPLLSGAGDSIETAAPYRSFRTILWQITAWEDLGQSNAERREELTRRWATEPEVRERLPLLNLMLPLELEETSLTRNMDGRARGENTRELVLQWLERWRNGRPLLLILDDVHWLDSASWALVEALRRRVDRLFLVLASRTVGDMAPEYQRLRDLPDAHVLHLDVLEPREVEQLVCQQLGAPRLPQAVVNLLLERSGGHPYFSIHLAGALHDTGVLRLEDGRCAIAPGHEDLSTLELPTTIEAVVSARLDRLSAEQQLTLKVASVIGRSFEVITLADIHPTRLRRRLVVEHIEAAGRLELTAPRVRDLVYMFKHLITHEVAYSLLLFAQRRKLHRLIAEWLEGHRNAIDSTLFNLLAHHWHQVILGQEEEEPELILKVIDYLDRAGKQALDASAPREAEQLYAKALDLLAIFERCQDESPKGLSMKLRLQMGSALIGQGKLTGARDHLEKAAALAGKPFAKSRLALATKTLLQVGRQVGYRLRARWSQASDASDLARHLRIESHLIYIYYLGSQRDRYLHTALRMVNLAERSTPCPEKVMAYTHAGTIAGFLGLHKLAESYFRTGYDAAGDLEATELTRAYISSYSSLYLCNIGGRWRRIRRETVRATDAFQQAGDWFRWAGASSVRANAALYQGDLDHCSSVYDDIYSRASQIGNQLFRAYGAYGQAAVILRRRAEPPPIQLIEESIELCDDSERNLEICATGDLALAYWLAGDSEAARQAAEQTEQLLAALPRMPVAHYLTDGLGCLAETWFELWRSGHPDTAPAAAEGSVRSCRLLHRFARSCAIGQPMAWLAQGWLEWQNRRHRKALRAWQRSLTVAEKLEMPWEAARAHCELGQHLRDESERAQHSAQARHLFQQLQVSPEGITRR